MRYWAAGAVLIIVAWLSFFLGFVGFLTITPGNLIATLVYALIYAIVVPYILGRVVE